jgi:hypothetical protein
MDTKYPSNILPSALHFRRATPLASNYLRIRKLKPLVPCSLTREAHVGLHQLPKYLLTYQGYAPTNIGS